MAELTAGSSRLRMLVGWSARVRRLLPMSGNLAD
jgi:hypothetical protein